MEKKNIGTFIAALRKAHGMTQQELADRLSVSNKAVSRWERDENAPDLSLIPAIAEIFGVTCDELLKGERIFRDTEDPTKPDPKVDKQLKALVNRSTSTFKTIIYISIALAMIGLVAMIYIPFALEATRDAEDIFQDYRDYADVGIAVMLLFEIISLMLTAIAISRMIDTRRNNELFENPDTGLLGRYNRVLTSYSYLSFCTTFSAVVISLSFSRAWSEKLDFGHSLEKFDYPHVLIAMLLVLAVLFLKAKELYTSLLVGKSQYIRQMPKDAVATKMNGIQWGCLTLLHTCALIHPLFFYPADPKLLDTLLPYVCGGLILAILGLLVFFLIRNKSSRNRLLFFGLRNCALAALTGVTHSIYHVWWSYDRETISMKRNVQLSFDQILILTGLICGILLLFEFIGAMLCRKNKL